MKTRTLLATMALLGGFATTANAQEAGTFRPGVGLGINVNSISNNVLGSKVGFNIGVKGDYFFTDNLYLGTGLFFNQKGAKKSVEGGKIKEVWNYLELPVHIGYRHPVSDNVAIFGEFGPYFGYAVSGKYKIGDASTSIFDLKVDEDGEISDKGTDIGAKRFNVGLGIHAGVEFSKFQVRLGYDFALTPNVDTFGGLLKKQKHGTFTIGAAYLF